MALTDVQKLNTAWEKWTEDLKIHRGTLADYQLDLQKAVDNDMLKANQHDTMRIHSPERSSRTSFGSSQNRSK